MPATGKRRYRSEVRAAGARRTRQRIREAAGRLFVEQGFAVTTMREVAATAGVAERTVYLAYPTKIKLFREVLAEATGEEGGEVVGLLSRTELRTVLDESDARRGAARLVDLLATNLERVGPLLAAGERSAGADPDLHELARNAARTTSAALHEVAASWGSRGTLRDGRSVADGAATLVAVASPQLHEVLRREHGFDADRYRDWLFDLIVQAVLR